MAPPRAEAATFLRLSSPFMGGLGSVIPVVLMILLLLLCFRFKRKKRQLSTRSLKRDLNSSQLIRMTKLEDGLSPEEKPLEGGKMHKGGSSPNHQAGREANGFAADLQSGNSVSPEDNCAVSPNNQITRMSDLDRVGILGPQAACPNVTCSLQFRKLPMTPKEVHISKMEPLNQSMDNQVYESIGDEDRELCAKGWLEQREGPALPARAKSPIAESREPGGKETLEWASGMPSQPVVALQSNRSQQQLQEMASEEEAPAQLASDTEKRLSMMYARVCKKPKTAQQLQPANHDRPTEQEEEEPPPIPEKRFEDLYESLGTDVNMQGGEMPRVTSPNA